MNMRPEIDSEDELSIVDVWNFLNRQYKTIILIFSTLTLIVLVFAFTRPTLYESTANILVGERFYFNGQQLIEPVDQMKYIYTKNATINPIKNTRVVQITSKNVSIDESKTNVKDAVDEIINAHKKILSEKREEFIKLLTAVKQDNKQVIDLIDTASTSTVSKQIGETESTTLKYSGQLNKILGGGIALSIFLALSISVLIDLIQRNKLKKI
jgi:sensor c-di-GMP phosphodiesterase-like protein